MDGRDLQWELYIHSNLGSLCGIVHFRIENKRLFGHCWKSNTFWSGLTHRY